MKKQAMKKALRFLIIINSQSFPNFSSNFDSTNI